MVRVMKMQQRVTHVDLIQKMIEEVRRHFQPDMAKLKECIELLIEKGFMERSSEERDTYLYVA